MSKKIVALALMLAALNASAQTIYQGKDASGKPVFTDQPKAGDKPVDLPPVNTVPPGRSLPPSSQPSAPFAGYSQVALSAPGSVPNPYVPVQVSIQISPALQPGHMWQLALDGRFAAAGVEAGYSFPQLERGQHTLDLRIVDGSGQTVAEAAPVEIFVQFQGKHK